MKLLSEFISDDHKKSARVLRQDEFTFVVQLFVEQQKASHAYYHDLNTAEAEAEDYVMSA